MKLKTCISLFKSDIRRLADHTDVELTRVKWISLFFMPSIQAIFLYRLSRYFYLKNWMIVSRILYTINLAVWGTDITPSSRIGHSFYMPHTSGVTLFAIIGDRCTCYAQAAVGGGSGNENDIGAGPGLPIVGDDVLLGARSMIVGPVRIGDGSMIGANAFVTQDLPDNTSIIIPPSPLA